MKSLTITSLLAFVSFAAMPVSSYSIQPIKRQVDCLDIGYYFKLVNTALFSVNYVQNYAHPCDVDLIPYFESQGLNGLYAMDLICLYNAGTRLFNESLAVVNDNLIVTLVGLFDAAAFNNDPSRNLSCANIDTDLLDAIGLDFAVIKSIICDYTPCTIPSTSRSSSTMLASSSVSSNIIRSSSAAGSSGVPSSSGFLSGTGVASSTGVLSSSGVASSSVITRSTDLLSSSVSPSGSLTTIVSDTFVSTSTPIPTLPAYTQYYK